MHYYIWSRLVRDTAVGRALASPPHDRTRGGRRRGSGGLPGHAGPGRRPRRRLRLRRHDLDGRGLPAALGARGGRPGPPRRLRARARSPTGSATPPRRRPTRSGACSWPGPWPAAPSWPRAGPPPSRCRARSGIRQIHEVPVKLARLPRQLSGLSIAQITDLHVGRTIGEDEVRRVVERHQRASAPTSSPLTGDFVDGSVRMLEAGGGAAGRAPARYGVFFVTGNHEYYSGAAAWVEHLRRLGHPRAAERAGRPIGDRGRVHRPGRHRRLALGRAWLRATVRTWRRRSPAAIPTARWCCSPTSRAASRRRARAGVELQISGHTHGGQIFPFTLATALVYPYLHGLYRGEGRQRLADLRLARHRATGGPPCGSAAPPRLPTSSSPDRRAARRESPWPIP